MPQATEEHRARMGGVDDGPVISFLQNRGYRLTHDWCWHPPEKHEITLAEMDAISFLINEWDFGDLLADESRLYARKESFT